VLDTQPVIQTSSVKSLNKGLSTDPNPNEGTSPTGFIHPSFTASVLRQEALPFTPALQTPMHAL